MFVPRGGDLEPSIGATPCLPDTHRAQPLVIILKNIFNYWINLCEKWPVKLMCSRFAEFFVFNIY